MYYNANTFFTYIGRKINPISRVIVVCPKKVAFYQNRKNN